MMSFVIKSIRSMFFSLDKIIYGLIDDVYSLLLTIARTSIFDNNTIAEFASRIYAIAGIFMLFKVSLSIIQYVINPDALVDKDKGFAALGKRIVTSLVLLVLCPYLFQEAYELQTLLLEENTIMNLVFGTTSIKGLPTDDYALNAGKNIQFTTMYTFLQPNYEELYLNNDDGINLSACAKTYDSNQYFRDGSQFIRKLNDSCFGTYNDDLYKEDGALAKAFKEYADEEGLAAYQNYAQGVAQQDFNLMMRQDLILVKDSSDVYLINYRYAVSTAVGVAIVYIFLLFCIDIAIRSVKLGFLEMMAPIPILSYIEPKGKDGMFKKWYQMCFTTYISLFLRLFALYLGVYAITVVGTFTDVVTDEPITGNWLLNVFMIIGILIFVKQLPKIIEDIFGIKLDGKFSLNPFKRIEEEALGGKRLTGLLSGAAMGTLGAFSGAGAGRALSGAWSGFWGNKGFADTWKTQRDKNAAMRTARLDGSTFAGRMGARFSNALGTGGTLAEIEAEKSRLERRQGEYDDAIKSAEDRILPTKNKIADQKRFADAVKEMEKRAKDEIAQGNGGAVGAEYLRRKAEFERLKSGGRVQTGTDAAGNPITREANSNDIALAEAAMNEWLNDTGMKRYMSEASSGAIDDATFSNLRANAKQAGTSIGVTLSNDGGTIHRQLGESKGAVGALERSIYDAEQEIQHLKDAKADLGDELRAISDRERVAKANQNAIK